jgi:hypothetical protein
MNKKQLIAASILTLLFITSFIYAEQSSSTPKDVSPELQLKEEDFTYDGYKDSLGLIKSVLDDYEKGKKYDPNLDRNYIVIPNSLLRLEGYSLLSQMGMLRLKVENAKLRQASKEEINKLEKELQDIEKQISVFLKKHTWVD